MEKTYAILNSGNEVVNLIVWDGNTANWQPPQGCTAVEVPDGVQVSIGYGHINGRFTAPAAPSTPPAQVPHLVTMRQARLALLAVGKLQAVDDAIAALSSPQKEAAHIEWNFSAFVERQSQIVQLLGPALGLDEDALDALFVQAAAL